MIICFTGTGNSRRIADMVSKSLGDSIERLAPGLMRSPEKASLDVTDGRLIWVLPIHAWGMPLTVENVLAKITVTSPTPIIHHLIVTCGDDIGYADNDWRGAVEARGWICGSAFSVQMPNNYTFIRGFDIDSEKVAQVKLATMPERVDKIIEAIDNNVMVTDVVRGSYPWIKTRILHRLFIRFLTNTKPFHATDDCNSCGQCMRNCPLSAIQMQDGKPNWTGVCTMCSRCYHACPHHAVAYGRATAHKGQYMCPGYHVNR